jgi:hypothetical protein
VQAAPPALATALAAALAGALDAELPLQAASPMLATIKTADSRLARSPFRNMQASSVLSAVGLVKVYQPWLHYIGSCHPAVSSR